MGNRVAIRLTLGDPRNPMPANVDDRQKAMKIVAIRRASTAFSPGSAAGQLLKAYRER
jgi:hypothetical protein